MSEFFLLGFIAEHAKALTCFSRKELKPQRKGYDQFFKPFFKQLPFWVGTKGFLKLYPFGARKGKTFIICIEHGSF